METDEHIHVYRLSPHVVQVRIPTPTLPPSFETNTYIVHDKGEALWVDAGTEDTRLLDEALAVLDDMGITNIVGYAATHYHRDHTHGLPYVQLKRKAPIYVHVIDLAPTVEEMGHTSFPAASAQAMPDAFAVGGVTVQVKHAPGHTRGHVHLVVSPDDVILVGDHLAGSGSVWIGPPDGHMASYYTALDAIRDSGCTIAGPGHGPALMDAPAAATALRERREMREREVLAAIEDQPLSANELVDQLYGDTVPAAARLVAVRTMQAHLIHLTALNLAAQCSQGRDDTDSRYYALTSASSNSPL